MEKLAVEGAVSGAASGSKNPDGNADHWSGGAVSTKDEGEKVRQMVAERQEMNGMIPESQPSSNEVGGDFIMWRRFISLCVKLKNSKQGVSKYRAQSGVRRDARQCS